MTVPGARWDVGKNLALASEIPNVGYDLDQLVGVDQDWTLDTSSLVQAAIDAVSAAGGGEIVVRNEGRTYLWQGLQMRSKVGLRFLGHPTIQKAGIGAATHIIEFNGAEGDVASPLVVDHPLADNLTVVGASWSGSVATITTSQTHNLLVGDQVQLGEISPSGYNVLALVTAVNAGAKTFSYALTSNPGTYVSGGWVDPLQYLVHPTDASGFTVGDVVAIADDVVDVVYALVANITAATWDSGTKTATVTFATNPAGAAGDLQRIAGVASSGPGSFNGVVATITHHLTAPFTITYKVQTDPGTYTSGGTGTYVEAQHVELNKITSITGNVVVMERALVRSYLTASNARLVKLDACEDAYILGPVSMTIPAYVGGAGGGLFWNHAYNTSCKDVDVYGPSDDPAFSVGRSGKVRFDGWGAYNGQRMELGGNGYGMVVLASAHDVLITNGFSSHIRENAIGSGAVDVTFENNEVMWTYSSGINTHGKAVRRVRIADNHIEGVRGYGIVIGNGQSDLAADTDIEVINNDIYDPHRGGIEVEGHSDGTKNIQRVRVKGNRIYRARRDTALLVMYSDDVEVEDNLIEGNGTYAGQSMIYVHNGSNLSVRDNKIRGNGSDYGIRWATVVGLDVANNRVRGMASYNLWGATSSGVKLGPNVLDDIDVLLEGTETLVGSESLAGALRATLADTDITPDPVYRYHAWSISQVRTMHAPTATKRVVGQRITFDITNTALIPVTPVWDAAFVLGAPFRLKAA